MINRFSSVRWSIVFQWVGATAVGAVLGGGVIIGLAYIVVSTLGGLGGGLAAYMSVRALFQPVVAGAAGLMQWLVLRALGIRAGWWAPA